MTNKTSNPTRTIAALRHATAAAHQALNEHDLLVQLMRPDLIRATYADILVAFHGVYAPIERVVIGDHLAALRAIGLHRRARTPLLLRDLRALGYGKDAIERLPICRDLPAVATLSAMLGCIYVLDGATLGGRVISRQVRKTLDLDADTGLAFFGSAGADVAGEWRHLIAVIEANTTAEADRRQAADCAALTFACFESWLDRAAERRVA